MLEVFELQCFIQNYLWGKKGLASEVSRLSLAGQHIDSIDEKQFYAELWMGALHKSPSLVKSSGQKLSEWIKRNNEALGEKSRLKFGDELPFLMKVLSINSALSIQVHPSKDYAEELHKQYPELYQDSNHKPEMAIALSNFEGLCGFRPYSEIRFFLEEIPEFKLIVGCDLIDQFKKDTTNSQYLLKDIFYKLMTSEKGIISQNLSSHKKKLQSLCDDKKNVFLAKLFNQLDCWYPNDVGCFCIYFLNYIQLSPDCIECMACSDNVVRAGLTPKYIDVKTLCRVLNFNGAPAESKLFCGVKENSYTTLFRPPVPDFAVACIKVPADEIYELLKRDVASIIIVVHGQGKITAPQDLILSAGKVFMVPANVILQIHVGFESLELYQAFVNL
ncbi:mannose-6-phosphate isomerase isoform X2 [Acyrthosiphon pisum]|uniref:mannose-6-phosphate isomerase n=1 Tax=Acyrthosiphon pisum TaxID=7029 RepID=A0A8R2FB49_ACYPI|nr:mannose-6-phosphate isomerase isoform X2 [Acyrthosiphon pisum]|eukprot:XP_008187107.1 PREDICTED: mannose-6-phosphate isomerase isoform X2 [Acyrthosiphon pisum]